MNRILDGLMVVVFAVYEAVLDGVVGEFGVVGHVHFTEDAGAVSADGGDAEGEFFGDLADLLAGGDHSEDEKLAVGEPFVRSFVDIDGEI